MSHRILVSALVLATVTVQAECSVLVQSTALAPLVVPFIRFGVLHVHWAPVVPPHPDSQPPLVPRRWLETSSDLQISIGLLIAAGFVNSSSAREQHILWNHFNCCITLINYVSRPRSLVRSPKWALNASLALTNADHAFSWGWLWVHNFEGDEVPCLAHGGPHMVSSRKETGKEVFSLLFWKEMPKGPFLYLLWTDGQYHSVVSQKASGRLHGTSSVLTRSRWWPRTPLLRSSGVRSALCP